MNTACADFFPGENLLAPQADFSPLSGFLMRCLSIAIAEHVRVSRFSTWCQVKNTFIHFDLLLFDFDLEPESCLLRVRQNVDNEWNE